MKSKFPLLAILLIGAFPLFSQINYWGWAQQASGYGQNDVNGSLCAADNLGNVYVTGAFNSPTMQFGSFTLTRHDTSAVDNIFIVKYNSAGNVVWANSAGGDKLAFSRGIAVDPAGNVYICGWFFGDSLVFENTLLRASNLAVILQDSWCFIAKYDASGTLAWAKTQDTTGAGQLITNTIGADAAGNIYTAGSVSAQNGPLIFEGITLVTSSISVGDITLVKFDANGHPVWAKTAPCTGPVSYAFGINTDAAGNSCFTGFFQGTATFGSTVLTGAGNQGNFFVARYDSAGNPLWAGTSNTPVIAEGAVINVDNTGNIYLAGTYRADSFSVGSVTLHAQGLASEQNMFLAKYNNAGAISWLSTAGTAGLYGPTSVAFDSTGGIIVAGASSDSLFITGADTLKTAGNSDIFLQAFDTSGSLQWAKTYGGTGDDVAYACNNPHGNIFITGMFSSDTLMLDNYTFTDADTPASHTFVASVGYQTAEGVPGISNNDFLHIYPNPSTGSFMAVLPGGTCTVSIINPLGQIIETRQLQGPATASFSLNTGGIYLIQVKTGDNLAAQKVVIAH